MLSVLIKPGPPGPVRAGVQPGQLHAPLRPPERGVPLVAFEHTAQAGEDWRQDYQSLQDDCFPVRRGGGTREAVQDDAVENPPSGESMRKGAGLELVNDEAKRGAPPVTRDDCPRTTGKHEDLR